MEQLTDRDVTAFLQTNYRLINDCLDAESTPDFTLASNLNFSIAQNIASFLQRLRSNPDQTFFSVDTLKRMELQISFRIARAVAISSHKNVNFGNLSFSFATERKIEEDLKKISQSTSSSNDVGNTDADLLDEFDETLDPFDKKLHAGLLELPDYSSSQNIADLIGYREETKQMAFSLVQEGLDNKSKNSKSVILFGPPGSGKTTSAIALAKQFKFLYVYAQSTNLVSAYIGQTTKNLRYLYKIVRMMVRARAKAENLDIRRYKAVLLIDEVDGIIKNRAANSISSDEYSRITTMLQILEANDGSDNSKIISIFTTNRLDNLDSAFIQRCIPIFFGYIVNPEERYSIFNSIISPQLDKPISTFNNFKVPFDFVPRDWVRLVNKDIKDARLNKVQYFSTDLNNLKSLVVEEEIPKLSFDEFTDILSKASAATPITSYFSFVPPRDHVINWINANPNEENPKPKPIIFDVSKDNIANVKKLNSKMYAEIGPISPAIRNIRSLKQSDFHVPLISDNKDSNFDHNENDDLIITEIPDSPKDIVISTKVQL
ncbi:hypothetical protein HCN44_010410 [Aphidius gifuensis]|uniref:AAA+ ATPase domain-containing protein n=1 Tax=Aphidius gifuensis TaxID=684658 RepID=A0A834XK70_APHGI|nr:hypothetical protein HCN44_010410 [Aphidius gifuensis]